MESTKTGTHTSLMCADFKTINSAEIATSQRFSATFRLPVYERAVRPELSPEHEGKSVVIDVESGDYEVSDDEEAFGRAEVKNREAVFFILHVGPKGAPRPAYRIRGYALPGAYP